MISKVFSFALLVACSQAVHYDNHHQATSFAQFNNNHNSIHHIQSAYAHSAPAYAHAAPVYAHAAPVHSYTAPAAAHGYAAQSYSSISHNAAPAAHYAAPLAQVAHYAAPVAQVAHYAAPVVAKVAVAPAHHAASSYSSLNLGHSGASAHYAAPIQAHYAAPVAHYAAPVAKVVAPVAYAHAPAHYQHEEYAPAHYQFEYGVADQHTGDIHSHKEAREGDVTHGEYSLHEADGTVRTVKYSVDKHSGFNAVVERSGHAQHVQPAKAIVAAPIKTFVAAAPHAYHH